MSEQKPEKTKFQKARKLKSADGTIVYLWENKLHNWDGPARIPQGERRKREYYIHGIQLTEEEWKERRSEREGLPWYKATGNSENTRF